jgi:hypothetical protein
MIQETLIIRKIKMDRNTLSKIQNYLRLTLGSKQLKVEGRENKVDSADVTINGEFLGVIFEDKEDGDVCYHFNMTILDIDLKD